MKYYSEVTDKVYDSVEELEQAEAKREEELRQIELDLAEKQRRLSEIEGVLNSIQLLKEKAFSLRKAYYDDYGIEPEIKCPKCKCRKVEQNVEESEQASKEDKEDCEVPEHIVDAVEFITDVLNVLTGRYN